MPPRRKQPDMAFLAEALKLAGIDSDPDLSALGDVRKEYDRLQVNADRQARAQMGVLTMLHKPHSMMTKNCKSCKKPFMTSYCYQEWCTDKCRQAEWSRLHGIDWDDLMSQVETPPADWQYEPHVSVTPEELERLVFVARKIVEGYDEAKTLVTLRHPDSPTPGLDRLFEKWGVEQSAETIVDSPLTAEALVNATTPQNQVATRIEFDPLDFDLSEFDV